ncbi:MAG: CRISPR-associated endonuclease Cas2 [Methanomassiliicoccaceae archaeon]|jgi:CRISPR-associated protein Cas2|nr:CRISPR-associated endonuclease Cas2 [Methanomassiliicoccaceae archaeon]
MMILIAYDISPADRKGRMRLKEMEKICTDYGQRVQDRVYECLLDPEMMEEITVSIQNAIDVTRDTVRFYNLGSRWKNRKNCMGADHMYDPEGLLMV